MKLTGRRVVATEQPRVHRRRCGPRWLFRRFRLGYAWAFIAGCLATHYAGFSRSARTPLWLDISGYVASGAAVGFALWALWGVQRLRRSMERDQ